MECYDGSTWTSRQKRDKGLRHICILYCKFWRFLMGATVWIMFASLFFSTLGILVLTFFAVASSVVVKGILSRNGNGTFCTS
jgi:hypothetical protein